MCKCGCNTCETKIRGPLLTEGLISKSLISENLQYHIDKNIPLMENVFRIGSDAHLSMIKEARKLYTRGVLDLCEEDEALMETHIGEFDLYENEIVRIRDVFKQMDIEDEIANEEFGMDYDQLGSNEKDWVRDEIDNMSINEAKKKKKKEKKDPPIGKPKRGGSKAYYVYVRDPKTKKIKKVSFGGGLRAKIKNKEALAFLARHKCSTKKDRTKAGYWSCNLPRYASQLGLGANMNTFW